MIIITGENMLLRVLFIVLALVSAGCAVKGSLDKRRNIGFIIMSTMIAIGDILYVALLFVSDAKGAGKVLLPYYMMHSWFLFVFMIMVLMIDRYKRLVWALILPGILSAYQTYLVISQYFGARVFSFQKRMYFRRPFWVAIDSKNTGILFSYRSYRIATYISMFIVLCVLVICIIYSHKIFKIRYYALILMAVAYTVAEVLIVSFSGPVWLSGVFYNLLSLLCLYYVSGFARNRLQEWSLDRFANDMSDGLILYDQYNDLIHLNDMVKNTLPQNLLEDFKDKDKLKRWIETAYTEEDRGIIVYRRENREYYFKVMVNELGDERTRIGSLYILHDTTDSVTRLQAMERANEELERANHMKSDFLANMSHEIRTPMNAVIGMAEIALRENDPATIADHLRQIQSSGKNLLNIINDILDYSKIESGKMEIIEDEYIPFEEISDIANVLATRIGEKPLELFVLVETGLAHKLKGDAMRIRQILINLANNAIKFTKQGMVCIRLTCEPVSEDMVNMIFHVIDTGIGIKKEDMDKLFVSFQQVDSKRNRSVEGTGLGLAISQRLVEAMSGTIGVKSEYGKGSDFWFTVPQKVIDGTDDIQVEHASEKKAFVLNENPDMVEVFVNEMDRLGVEGHSIQTLSEYHPSGKKDYLFFEEDRYDARIREFLDEYKDVTGIILVGLSSEFVPDQENLHIMRRPESTMAMVQILNDQFQILGNEKDKLFHASFTAPEAKVLIVDDNHLNLTIAEGLIAPLKMQVDTADSGQKAVELAHQKEYDIILMDHMMPEVDGVDATRMIRASAEITHQPVIIALSANVMEEARRLFREAGMNDFVGKPIDIQNLTSVICKWLPAEKIVKLNGFTAEEAPHVSTVKMQSDDLDIENAVRALGSAALYDKIAEEYYNTGEDRLQSIRAAYDSGDWDNYTIRVHSLKSSSRQIGAMKLGSMAEVLEKAGKSNDIDTIHANTEGTLEVFRTLLEEMAVYYKREEEDDSDKPMIDSGTLEDLLSELESYCDNLELDGMEEIRNRLKEYSFGEKLREPIHLLYKAISDIDTDGCEELIRQIRAVLHP